MKLVSDSFYKQVAKCLALIVGIVLLARLTRGYSMIPIVGYGVFAALSNRVGRALFVYLMIILMLVLSPAVGPQAGALWGPLLRFGPLLVSLALCVGAARRAGRIRLPLGGMVPFLIVAAVSSIDGWAPLISYMKIVNFSVFLLGIWLGTQNIYRQPREVEFLRAVLFAFAVFIVLGSIAVMPFPQISYATGLRMVLATEGAAAAAAAYRETVAQGGQTLFCGITCHSQWLSPLLSALVTLVLCDMLFLEKRICKPHLLLIALAMPMLYMTRSRVAFMTTGAALLVVNFYALRKTAIPARIRSRLSNSMLGMAVLLVLVLGGLELKDHTISRWLRKTQDVAGDERGLTEAITASRIGLMEQSMYEFRRNPLFGSGFQVMEWHQNLAQKGGLIFTAPIEKGILPVMVLGETGIVGALFFVIFLVSFYVTASKRKLHVTVTLFTVLFVSNLGEASFFAPGGIGGAMWVISVVGGFIIDSCLLSRRLAARLMLPR